ncbi:LamG-like jellyroll fold domain-containing protein [Micromonospora lupini]|uniref:LamG-like jellyroll fold domain-containing protein n=1 Tax=Micromonospora lupini TaxID=285679 RepID=UPI0033D8FAD1
MLFSQARIRARSRGWACALVAATVALAGVASTPQRAGAEPVEAAPNDSPVAAELSESEALAAAKRSGHSVEATTLKSENSRVLASPNGSLVLESYPVPRWVNRRDGNGWRTIDTSLRKASDGSVAPVATLTDLSFSAGGMAAAVRLPVDGGELSLTWPGSLPPPRVEADTAIYESVLPDVDLRLRALPDGFTWVVVVKSASAATNPALETLRFRLDTPGLTKRERPGGGFQLVNGAGQEVLGAGNALMWDSSGLTAKAQANSSKALASFAAEEKQDALRTVPDRARKSELTTEVRDGDLVIRPDLALLRGKDTTYPVAIDPWTTIGKAIWGYTGTENATRDDGVARVGKNPDGSGNYRSFFRFNLASLSGKTIRSAKFLTEMTHSWSCTSTPVNLYRTAELGSSGKQSWDGPNLITWLEERSGHAHKPPAAPSCSNDPQPDLPMEFSNLKTDVSANRGEDRYTLALAARQSDGTSESESTWWKKFDPAMTKLTVEYNTNPNTPTAAQLSTHAGYTGPAQACVTGASRPMVRSDYPWLKATLSDPDGSNGGSLSGVFTLQKLVSGAWATATGWPKTDAGVAPGAKAEVQLTTKTVSGDVYRWQVQAKDTLGGSSSGSPWCEFYVDYAAPTAMPKVAPADALYLESPPLGTNQDARGSVGYSGRFTFSANGATDVYDYVYQIAGGAEQVVKAATLGGSATVWVTPNSIGENVLSVKSRDQAGNATSAYDYVFFVGSPSAAKADWAINEGSGTTLTNSVSGGQSATLTPNPSWTESRLRGVHKNRGKDWAVKFFGVKDYAITSSPVIDTSRSFSVAAWVRADAAGGIVVSQPGTSKSPFELQYFPTKQRWCFVTYASDVANAAATAAPACATNPVQVGVWTHLTGVYDAGAASSLSLYVNGVLNGTGSTAPLWPSSGPLAIGVARAGGLTGWFNGLVGDVQVWDRVVDPDIDLSPLVQPVLVGQWDMEDYDYDAPRQEADGSGYQRPLNLTDAPTADWSADGYNFSSGLALDGLNGQAATDSPVLRTDQSYTVAAWARWNGGTGPRTVFAQDGSQISGFFLTCRNDPSGRPKWSLMNRNIDSTSSSSRTVYGSDCVANAWVHLAAVQDVTTQKLSLYVNGQLSGTVSAPTPWSADGVFTVGRSKYGVLADFFPGDIDRVRAWQGALSDADIAALFAEA